MEKERLQKVMEKYQKTYETILNHIWPTIGSNGFIEQNQTVNYINAYSELARENNEVISTWYEFQIPSERRNNNHIDGMIINHTKREIYLIEAKRISMNKMDLKKKELKEDFERLNGLDVITRFNQVFVTSESISEYSVYGVLLFDLWTETDKQKDFFDKWERLCGKPDWNEFKEILGLEQPLVLSREPLPMMNVVSAERWKDEDYSYYLMSFVWNTEKVN